MIIIVFGTLLAIAMNKDNKAIKDTRYPKAREKIAKELCHKCKLHCDARVSLIEIPLVEETFN